MRTSSVLVLAALWVATVDVSAAPPAIDTSRYFAWQKLPDQRRGGVSIYRPYLFLSREKCEAKGIGKGIVAMKGISIMPGDSKARHECWAERESDTIVVCTVGDVPTGAVGNACLQLPKSSFEDIQTLPRTARF